MVSSPLLLALLAALLLVAQAPGADAHSRLLKPPARFGGFCGMQNSWECTACGPRDKSNVHPENTVYTRGQKIPIEWARNNHPGGFIKLAIIPYSPTSVETFEEFDRNIVQFSCHESNCASGYPNDPFGEDGPGIGEDGKRCSTQLTIPNWLADGQYTLQWHWFGGSSFFGAYDRGQTDFYGCHDFTVRGGAALNANAKPSCPTFIPGDAHHPAQNGVCKYFGSGKPLSCRPDGCRGEWHDGIPAQLQTCLNSKGGSVGIPEAASIPETTAAVITPTPTGLAQKDEPLPCTPAPTVTVTATTTAVQTVTVTLYR